MELKRLGLCKQPWIVVPNHIVEQVGREAAQWYPAARILLGNAGTDPDGRRRFVAQSATTDWDMVIMPPKPVHRNRCQRRHPHRLRATPAR